MDSRRAPEIDHTEDLPSAAIDLREEVLRCLRRIIRATYLHSKKLQAQLGLTTPQLVVMRELADARELSGSELAHRVSLSAPTVAGILSRLEARGLVQRRRPERDRRQLRVSLTEEGAELLRGAPPPLQEQFAKNLAKLADWEQSQVLATLQRIVVMMEAESVDASPILITGPEIRSGDTPGPEGSSS